MLILYNNRLLEQVSDGNFALGMNYMTLYLGKKYGKTCCVIGSWATLLLTSASPAQEKEQEKVAKPTAQQSTNMARGLLEEWVKMERTLSAEKHEWSVQKQHLSDMKSLYQVELGLLNDEIAAAGDAHKKDQVEMGELEKELALAKDEREAVVGMLKSYVAESKKLYARLPEPLRGELAREYETLTDDKLDPSADVLALTALLKATVKFNDSVVYSEELHTIDGTQKQLRILYMGLGAAYYISGKSAGRGIPGNQGWQWIADDSVFSEVSRAINIFKKSARPDLVTLPVEVQK
ncbi:DUF3450 family protein [Rubritalea tangerina]|uniref:DUF3450 family protein n=2 Tax=Rubritalea tangerina TaxID=430798 RepID=A0ABW4ZFW4_9BACT